MPPSTRVQGEVAGRWVPVNQYLVQELAPDGSYQRATGWVPSSAFYRSHLVLSREARDTITHSALAITVMPELPYTTPRELEGYNQYLELPDFWARCSVYVPREARRSLGAKEVWFDDWARRHAVMYRRAYLVDWKDGRGYVPVSDPDLPLDALGVPAFVREPLTTRQGLLLPLVAWRRLESGAPASLTEAWHLDAARAPTLWPLLRQLYHTIPHDRSFFLARQKVWLWAAAYTAGEPDDAEFVAQLQTIFEPLSLRPRAEASQYGHTLNTFATTSFVQLVPLALEQPPETPAALVEPLDRSELHEMTVRDYVTDICSPQRYATYAAKLQRLWLMLASLSTQSPATPELADDFLVALRALQTQPAQVQWIMPRLVQTMAAFARGVDARSPEPADQRGE